MKKSSSTKRKLILLVLNFAIFFTVYQVLAALHPFIGTILYTAVAAALAIAYFVINRGFSSPEADGERLPDTWSAVQKCAYLDEAKARHEKAKGLLVWFLPVILTLLLDVTYLFVLLPFVQALGL